MATITSFVLFVLTIIATWKIFEKAGEDGWKSLIPVYNTYIFFKIARNENFVKYLIGSIVLCIIFTATFIPMSFATDPAMTSPTYSTSAIIFFLLFVVATVWVLIIKFKMYKDFCETFSLPTAFAWGLLLLNSLFICIIGFTDFMETAEEVKDTEVTAETEVTKTTETAETEETTETEEIEETAETEETTEIE